MFSLRIKLNLCASIVFTLRPRMPAICRTEFPSASILITSRSRGVRVEPLATPEVERDRKSSTNFRSRSTSGVARGSTLTPREREVIKMLAEGNSVRQIAGILGLSVKTVEAHKFNLMRKLNIHNKAQL